MRFLLTSSGIVNASIRDALVELLGKPIAESNALCIPTGVQPFPGGPEHVYRFIRGATENSICGLGWKSLGVLELTAQSRQISEYTFKTFEAFTAATLIYVFITLTVILAMRLLEGRVAVPGFISKAAH